MGVTLAMDRSSSILLGQLNSIASKTRVTVVFRVAIDDEQKVLQIDCAAYDTPVATRGHPLSSCFSSNANAREVVYVTNADRR